MGITITKLVDIWLEIFKFVSMENEFIHKNKVNLFIPTLILIKPVKSDKKL